jgi:threonine/homoserine efflux transporter RhtA
MPHEDNRTTLHNMISFFNKKQILPAVPAVLLATISVQGGAAIAKSLFLSWAKVVRLPYVLVFLRSFCLPFSEPIFLR